MQKLRDKVEREVKTLPLDTIFKFSDVKVKDVSTDTLRKTLHRLHEKGIISIVERGHFKRIEPFKELLFVYGSLKKDFDNHDILNKKYSKRLGKAKTIRKFGMFEDTFGNYPYLIEKPILAVEGEIYEIYRRELLDRLDEFEGSPDYYERKRIKVKSHHGIKRAFAYIQPNTQLPKDQKPLKIWKNNTDHKIKKLHYHLENMIGV